MSTFVLSTLQETAVSRITEWFKKPASKAKIFYLAGYAGSGKSSLVPFIQQSLGLSHDSVCFATYTGKAALVLSSKTGEAVSTLHSLCYELVEDTLDPVSNKVHMVWRMRKNSPLKTAKLLVVDEISMINTQMMEDILRFNIKILVLGDPFQLPPVDGDAYFHEGYAPDFFLDEIHRQALENPIIWLSQKVRNGENIAYGTYGESVIKLPYDDADESLWKQADQVIVGTNKTRRALNHWFRKIHGLDQVNSKFPVTGDRLICLKNRWDDGLVNGTSLVATNNAKVSHDRESFKLSMTSDNTIEPLVLTDMLCSSGEILGTKLKMPYWEQKKMVSLDYGYAITCHKSQGSQYNDVLFVDEGFARWSQDNTYYRHLYTAITRAADHLIILE